jgi:dihydrofolate reductase
MTRPCRSARARYSALVRQLVYFVATSADGFIAGPAGQFDFFPMQGDHILAQARELPETLPGPLRDALGVSFRRQRFDTVLMGRKTLEPARAAGIVEPYAPLDTIVFSRSEPASQQGSLRVTNEDPLRVVRELKARSGHDLWLCGGAQLAGALLPELDELVLKINPVLAGDGIRLFESGFSPRQLELRGRRQFESGVTWLTFRVRHAQ